MRKKSTFRNEINKMKWKKNSTAYEIIMQS